MKHIGQPSRVDILLLLLVALIWGSAMPAIKLVVDDLGTFWTASARVGVGFLAVLPFFLFRVEWPSSAREWRAVMAVAMLNMVIPFLLIAWAMNHIEAGVGSLLLGTTPIIAMVMGHLITRDERITRNKLLAVFFAVSGVAVLAGADAIRGLGTAGILAQLAIILAGGCYVSAGFIMRRLEMAPVPFTTVAMGTGTVMLVSVSLATQGLPANLPAGGDLIALLWLGIVPTGLAYIMRYLLVKRVGVSTFALAMNTVPVFGIIIAALWLGETVKSTTLFALVLVLAGLMVSRLGAMPLRAGRRG